MPTSPVTSPQVDGMEVINDLATQLGQALRDLAIQRAQIKVLQAPTTVTDTPSS